MRNQKGTVMLALIVAMVVTAVLTAGIVVINTTSNIGAAKSTNFTKALYLAQAGVRYGADRPPGPPVTYTLSDSYQQMRVQPLVSGVRSTGIVYPGTAFEARMTITRGGAYSPAPETDTREHNRNILPLGPATFTNDLSAFDLTGIEDRIKVQAYLATGGSHAYWAALQGFRTNTTLDSDGCTISCLFIPISQTYVDYLRNAYNAYGRVSYSMQTKVGWVYYLRYAAQGINFRWHESSPGSGLYQGYAVSFMVFNSRTRCSNDYIPNSIKPGSGPGDNSLKDHLLLVLWKQEVVGGVETRKWLAYAELGWPKGVCTPPASRTPPDNDQMVTGWQVWYDGRVTDDASIGVRIDDLVWGETHYNEIKVFYGDASPYFDSTPRRTADANATNTNRQRYYPQWIKDQYFTTWPPHYFENLSPTDNTLTYWSYCPWIRSASYLTALPTVAGNPPEIAIPTARTASDDKPHNYVVTQDGTSGLTEPVWPSSGTVNDNDVVWQENGVARPTGRYDWFTVLNEKPQGTNKKVQWVLNPAATEIKLTGDNSTIRTYEFPLNSFPSGRKEIGLHGMANAGSVPLAFDDLSIIIMGKKE